MEDSANIDETITSSARLCEGGGKGGGENARINWPVCLTHFESSEEFLWKMFVSAELLLCGGNGVGFME